MSKESERSQFVQSLERGLAVIRAFSGETPALTLSEVARLTGLTRATARRILLTLQSLGYVRSDGRLFSLTPQVLTIAHAYLSSLNLWEIARPAMEELVERTHESSSAATLDRTDIVYVARVPTKQRIMTISLAVGSRLPAHATSMGRVLLAHLSPAEQDEFFDRAELHPLTKRTVTDQGALRAILGGVRERGWALVDQELEEGVRSIAAPLRGSNGTVLAALNVSTHAGRVSLGTVRSEFLPALLETAEHISRDLARTGVPVLSGTGAKHPSEAVTPPGS